MSDDRCRHEMLANQCSICLGREEPLKHLAAAELHAGELFDYAAAHPSFSSHQAQTDLGFSSSQFSYAVRALRLILASDNINLVCDTSSGVWQYKLVGSLDEALPWAALRMRSIEAQLQTVSSVAASIVKATSGHTRDGRRARLVVRQLEMLNMQLEYLDMQ